MSWIQTGVTSQSLSRKTAAIGAILLKFTVYQVGSSLLLALFLLFWTVLSFLLLALSADVSQKYFGPSDAAISAIVLPLLAVEICVWLLLGWQVAKRRIRTDTTIWRAQRLLKRVHPEYCTWLQRARRWSVLVPSAIALPVLLFLPETCAIASHIFNQRAGQLNQYRMRIPMTWMVFSSGHNRSDFSYVTLWNARGLMRSWQFEPLITAATFRTTAIPHVGVELPKEATVLSTKTLSIAGTPITCWEYLYPMHYTPAGNYKLIDCSTSDGRFSAWFGGQQQDISDFYKMFESVEKAE